MTQKIIPNQREIVMRDNDFIVSKTDSVGRLTYCNPIFIEFSGYTELELLGQQHNIVRHPDMPRAVFGLLWKTVQAGEEFFGYVKNMRKDGGFYWVFAYVTASYNPNAANKTAAGIIGFFSVRRKPDKVKLHLVQDIYHDMLAAEQRADPRDAVEAGMTVLNSAIQPTGKKYREFILTL